MIEDCELELQLSCHGNYSTGHTATCHTPDISVLPPVSHHKGHRETMAATIISLACFNLLPALNQIL